ncbi:MAG: nitroreductase family protein [Clostridiales bacterium]|nr:nitroreductase family protein [Clostridiales bacterium]
MELKEAIYGRRSVRKYDGKPVSEADIRDILEAGIMAPSASNLQPWYFVAVANKEKLDEVKEAMMEASDILMPSLTARFEQYPQVVAETRQFISLLGNAPLCILAFLYKDDSEYHRKETELIESTAAAMQNMLLTAYSKGISSCWLTAPLEAGMDTVLREKFAPGKGRMVAMMTFGYSDAQPRMPRRREGRYQIIL